MRPATVNERVCPARINDTLEGICVGEWEYMICGRETPHRMDNLATSGESAIAACRAVGIKLLSVVRS